MCIGMTMISYVFFVIDNKNKENTTIMNELVNVKTYTESENIEAEPTQYNESSNQSSINEEPTKDNVSNEEEYVEIKIPYGTTASGISSILYQNKLVDDEDEFTQYIISQGVTSTLNSGVFYIPVGSDYETILNIIY